jgi:hypothetical protein
MLCHVVWQILTDVSGELTASSEMSVNILPGKTSQHPKRQPSLLLIFVRTWNLTYTFLFLSLSFRDWSSMYNIRFSDVSIQNFLNPTPKDFYPEHGYLQCLQKRYKVFKILGGLSPEAEVKLFFLCIFHQLRVVSCVLTGKQTTWCSKSRWSRWEKRRAMLTLREFQGIYFKNQATHCGWGYFDISWGRWELTRRSDVNWKQCQSLI